MITQDEIKAIKQRWVEACPGCQGAGEVHVKDHGFGGATHPCPACEDHNKPMLKLIDSFQHAIDTIIEVNDVLFDPETGDVEHFLECHQESVPFYLRKFAKKNEAAMNALQDIMWKIFAAQPL